MKRILFILALAIFAAPNLASASDASTAMEQNDPRGRMMKKHRKATYGKRRGTKGTSCKKAHKIMKRRGNW